jgi:hypothetical protein
MTAAPEKKIPPSSHMLVNTTSAFDLAVNTL